MTYTLCLFFVQHQIFNKINHLHNRRGIHTACINSLRQQGASTDRGESP
jgi:hypothetical protein